MCNQRYVIVALISVVVEILDDLCRLVYDGFRGFSPADLSAGLLLVMALAVAYFHVPGLLVRHTCTSFALWQQNNAYLCHCNRICRNTIRMSRQQYI